MGIEPVVDSHSNPEIDDELANGKIMERTWGLEARVDPTVTFEEYTYWAEIERLDERDRNAKYIEKNGPVTIGKVLKGRFSQGIHHEERKEREKAAKAEAAASGGGKDGEVVVQANDLAVSEEEWKTAARALKTASWGTIFFLITTDILGWASCPCVFDSKVNPAYRLC